MTLRCNGKCRGFNSNAGFVADPACPLHSRPARLEDVARREIERALLGMPEDLELPKRAVVALCMEAFIRGASWEAGIDR